MAVKLNASKMGEFIHISADSFEHLLNCLDNQKFIHDVNADAMSSDTDYKAIQRNNQMAIDDFNLQCRNLLHK